MNKLTHSPHKAVAFERGTYGHDGRQKGYAARCETCGAVTFGGFRTKTEAKAALLHTEPTADMRGSSAGQFWPGCVEVASR